MAGRSDKEERSGAYKSLIKLPAAIGDWTTYKPPRTPVKKVRLGLYSFDRLSQSELKLALRVHYKLGRLLIRELRTKLNTGGELYSVSCEQTSYASFVKQVLQPVVHLGIKIPNIAENIHLLTDMNFADSLINLSLGSFDTAPVTRKFTEIEEKILINLLGEAVNKMPEALEGAIGSPALKMVSSSEMTIDSTIAPTRTFVYFTIEASLGDNPPKKMIVGYTGETLKNIITRYSQVLGSKRINLSRLPQAIQENIRVPITGFLAATSVATHDLKTLEPGDVVTLDTELESLLPILIGSEVELLGRAGIKNGKISMRLLGLGGGIPQEKMERLEAEELPTEEEEEKEEIPLEKEEEQEYPSGGEEKPLEEGSLDEDEDEDFLEEEEEEEEDEKEEDVDEDEEFEEEEELEDEEKGEQ